MSTSVAVTDPATATQEPELEDEPLDLSLLRELGKNSLINALNNVRPRYSILTEERR